MSRYQDSSGAWDDLHGFPNGAAFSEALKQAAATHYGHAGRAFLERLTRDTRDLFERLERIKALPEFIAEGGEGQDKRAAARFALVALAGEVATEYGITGWPEGTAIEAAAEGFKAWRSLRGPRNDERRQILEAVAGFIERHGDSRFSSVDKEEHYDKQGESLGPDTRIGAEAIVKDRAGWWRDDRDERAYLFNADGLREALCGFDFTRALNTLPEAGALPPTDASGERAKPQWVGGRRVRLYTIYADRLEADDGGLRGYWHGWKADLERLERLSKRLTFRRKRRHSLAWTPVTSGTAEKIKGESEPILAALTHPHMPGDPPSSRPACPPRTRRIGPAASSYDALQFSASGHGAAQLTWGVSWE
jgi:hypothetical protein